MRASVLEQVVQLAGLAQRAGATTRLAVATSALRDAANGPEVVARIAEVVGHPVRVLPGHEEARLSYLGVRAAIGTTPGGLAVLDLATELAPPHGMGTHALGRRVVVRQPADEEAAA